MSSRECPRGTARECSHLPPGRIPGRSSSRANAQPRSVIGGASTEKGLPTPPSAEIGPSVHTSSSEAGGRGGPKLRRAMEPERTPTAHQNRSCALSDCGSSRFPCVWLTTIAAVDGGRSDVTSATAWSDQAMAMNQLAARPPLCGAGGHRASARAAVCGTGRTGGRPTGRRLRQGKVSGASVDHDTGPGRCIGSVGPGAAARGAATGG